MKTPRNDSGRRSLRLSPELASTAVIGTLRPTEQRRATTPQAKTVPFLSLLPAGANAPSGAEGDRTPDLCSAIAALSQLSYSPAFTLGPRPSRKRPRASAGPTPQA